MKVLGIGETVIDKTTIMERASTMSRIVTTYRDVGGPIPAGLTLLRRLGIACEFVTAIGDDADGAFAKEQLTQQDITLHITPRSSTKRHTIVVERTSGQRQKLRGSSKNAPVVLPSAAILQTFDLILVDRHEHEAYREVLKHKHPKAHVVIDPSTEFSPFTKHMFATASHPIIPIETLVALGKASLQQALSELYTMTQKPFVVTLGKFGSLLFDHKDTTHFPPHTIAPIDSNGAGDVFRGAFAFGCLQGWSLLKSIAYANCAAALQCTRHGNTAALPSDHAIRYHLAHTPHRPTEFSDIEAHFTMLREEAIKSDPSPTTFPTDSHVGGRKEGTPRREIALAIFDVGEALGSGPARGKKGGKVKVNQP